MADLEWYRGKRVLVTGHTGFKGSWLVKMLAEAGADVTGYALDPPTEPNLFTLSGIENEIRSIRGDVRDFEALRRAFDLAKPDVVFHLAAQPIVRISYQKPRLTYETNVMGTVNVCECIRESDTVRSFLNVTTDKVYENREWVWGYREDEPLDGYDPYSNSKSCSELVTHSYRRSFLEAQGVAVSTARAGNVIGGGDFAADRIIPDCIRAVRGGQKILVRNPNSVRPYQHVLEPLSVYLMIASEQAARPEVAGSYNVGPDEADAVTTGHLADLFCEAWGEGAFWYTERTDGPHEANYLKLDCSKLKSVFGWKPRWNVEEAVARTVEWTKAWIHDPMSVPAVMDQETRAFLLKRRGENQRCLRT